MNPLETPNRPIRHADPSIGILGLVFTILFYAGLYPVTIFAVSLAYP